MFLESCQRNTWPVLLGVLTLLVSAHTGSCRGRNVILAQRSKGVDSIEGSLHFVRRLRGIVPLSRDEIAVFRTRIMYYRDMYPEFIPLVVGELIDAGTERLLRDKGIECVDSAIFEPLWEREKELGKERDTNFYAFQKRTEYSKGTVQTTRTGQQGEAKAGRGGTWPYHNYETLQTFVSDLSSTHEGNSFLFEIGQSVEDRSLLVLCIFTSAENATLYPIGYPKPRFKWIGNMHGDETVGREALLYLAQHLLDNLNTTDTGADAEAVRLLMYNTDVCIMPTMNPDGFEAGDRENANGMDLNRDFPDQFRDGTDQSANIFTGRQKETVAVMNWTRHDRFTLSANLHGGALVANYPYDSTTSGSRSYSASPDDELFISLATTYSETHPYMSQSREFANGITNGAEWYTITGGMQDWAYVYEGGWELTLELSNIKYPVSSSLQGYLDDNLNAMMALMMQTHTNVFGRVISNDSGSPLDAVIYGYGRDTYTYTRGAEAGVPQGAEDATTVKGYYLRPLPPGTHTVYAFCQGYKEAKQQVTVQQGVPLRLDFSLETCPQTEECTRTTSSTPDMLSSSILVSSMDASGTCSSASFSLVWSTLKLLFCLLLVFF